MNACLHCGNPTANPKFCRRSCAAAYNNARFPKRKATNSCPDCGKKLRRDQTRCGDCYQAFQSAKSPSPDKSLCSQCGKTFTWNPVGRSRRPSWCCQCLAAAKRKDQRDVKAMAVEYRGGQCVLCGYKRCLASLHFHHLEPKLKEFILAKNKMKSLSPKVMQELDKCVILCANCHGEVHAGLVSVP